VAWHKGLLVLAHAYGAYVEDALRSAPSRDDPYWAVSYHVVEPATAIQKVRMGSCTVSGPLGPAGSACIQGDSIDWAGTTLFWNNTHDWGSISASASLSPNGDLIAAADPDRPDFVDIWRRDGTIGTYIDGPGAQDWAGWIDDGTVILGSAIRPDWRPRIVTVIRGSHQAIFVNASGYYAARLPADVA
jgi:hypothetical protein